MPEDVNKIANEKYDPWFESKRPNKENELEIVYGFDWECTKENHDIWNQVYQGNYEPLREFHNL